MRKSTYGGNIRYDYFGFPGGELIIIGYLQYTVKSQE